MRFTHIFAAFAAFLAAASCSFIDIDEVQSTTEPASQYLEVVGRIAQYSDCDVATRSKKEGDEPKVTSMGLALFPIDDNGTIGNCLYYDFELGGSIVFIVDRHDEVFNNYVDKQFAMYIFANMQDAKDFPLTSADGVGKSLDYFTKCAAATSANVADIPANGFPMVGSLGNNVSIPETDGIKRDGYKLILKPKPTETNVDGLPLVDGAPTDNLEIPLKSLYAKFSFTISVKPDQEIVGNKAPRFDLLSYEVNNIAKTVDSNSLTNQDQAEDVIGSSGTITMGNYAQGATTAEFDFYLPERYLTPSNTDINDVLPDALKKGEYDESEDADGDGYRDEDVKYHQRYKNLMPGDGQKATYVTIKGKYTDHRENVYDVDYNIYLGGNSYDDFNIIRNTHYENSVTIRGISASDDQAVNPGAISIDWRVNVGRSTPLVIGLRRESLLDAHFEVRPLRLRLVGENIPTGTSATVQILNQDGTPTDIPGWVRLEESGSTDDDYITAEGASKGKRKYFTTNLVTETLADGGKTIEVNNLDGSNKTVWIYVDENSTTESRAAVLRVTYGGDIKDFTIVQSGLYKVTGADSGRDYYIEQYEEYLYNYDAEDSYGQTKQEGMPWGLNGKQLSNKYTSFDTDKAGTDWKSDYTSKHPLPYYDFYTKKHDGFATDVGGTVREYPGHAFTKEIAGNSNAGFQKLTLADPASSAVEYCYNRNKRQSDGTIKDEDVVWYLPSADELEDFIVPAYSSFKEFQDNYYWTSQPAYIRNIFYYEHLWYGSWFSNEEEIYAFTIYEDNTEYSRATKVVRKNGEFEPAPSGLNAKPTTLVDNRAKNGKSDYVNLDEYFYMMRYWKFNERAISNRKQYGQDKKGTANAVANGIDPTNGDYDEWYTETSTGKKYYVHLGHLYNMIQKTDEGEHGYHQRTKNNRVRCVRVKPTE